MALTVGCAFADTQTDNDIQVSVQVDGRAVHTDVDFTVDASPREAWAVLTDFDHMGQFMSKLQSSHVLSHSGNTEQIEQAGKAGSGPFAFSYQSVREIQLSPYQSIHAHMLSGTMQKFDSVTQLAGEGGKTHIHYQADAVSSNWIPPVIGRQMIASETRSNFADMRREILRRKQAASG
jgi:carbon monoxide dehydrogenase subunit G